MGQGDEMTTTPNSLSNAELSRVIAEFLGWRQAGARWHSPACQRDEEHCSGTIPDMVDHPAMTVMLLNQLKDDDALVCITAAKWVGKQWTEWLVELSLNREVSNKDLGRATAEAFAKAKGLI